MANLNTDFLVLSMKRGLIGDAISIDNMEERLYGTEIRGGYETTNRKVLKDTTGKVHSFYTVGPSMELTGYNGLLTDRFTHLDIQKLFHSHIKEKNIILDMDLDFFTYKDNEGAPWAMNDRNMTKIFRSDSFNYLFQYIDVINIALEPDCCGSNTECLTILEKMNLLIFRKIGIDLMGKVKPIWIN